MVATKRPYRMTVRAEAAAATAERILDAVLDVFWERPAHDISLEEVARRAGVSKQTVLRRFESKAGLIAAAADRAAARAEEERGGVEPGDAEAAVRVLVAHYERTGDRVLTMLAAEARDPALRDIADRGRDYHARWCADVFPAALAGLKGAERERRLAQLVAVCDVYTWKLLRRDRGLSRRQAELAIRELLDPILDAR